MVWMHHGLFTHSPPEGKLGCFQVLEMMNEDTVNIRVQVFTWTDLLMHLGKYQGAR